MTKLSGKRCLVDTNILVALVDGDHKNHQASVEFFDRLESGEFEAVISTQNVLELTSVLIRGLKHKTTEVAKDVEALTQDKIFEVIHPEETSLTIFFELLKKEKMHVVDLFLVATAIAAGVEVIISEDKDFGKLKTKKIGVYNPFIKATKSE